MQMKDIRIVPGDGDDPFLFTKIIKRPEGHNGKPCDVGAGP